jgi:hypothetical protein
MVVMMTVVAVVNSMPVIPGVWRAPCNKCGYGIKKIHAGDCTAKGRFLCEGVVLAERKSMPLDIPGTIDLGEGLEI